MEKTSLSLRCPSVRLNLDTRLVQRELFHLVKLKNSKLPGFVPWFHLAVVGVGMLFMSHVCTKKYQNPKIRFIWISMITWSCWYMYGYFTETCSLHVCRTTITGQFILDGIYIYIWNMLGHVPGIIAHYQLCHIDPHCNVFFSIE